MHNTHQAQHMVARGTAATRVGPDHADRWFGGPPEENFEISTSNGALFFLMHRLTSVSDWKLVINS